MLLMILYRDRDCFIGLLIKNYIMGIVNPMQSIEGRAPFELLSLAPAIARILHGFDLRLDWHE